jgi:hypothetical protein
MSNENELNEYILWLEDAIKNEYFNCYRYSDFRNIEPIGNGAFGRVVRANWKDNAFALKTFNNDKTTLKEVVNEV